MMGLPLSNGLLGSWTSWPTAEPIPNFSISGNGPLYLVETQCGGWTDLGPGIAGVATTLSTSLINSTANQQFWKITTSFPAGSVFETKNAANQNCTVKLTFGSGFSKYNYVSDEWGVISGGQIDTIVASKVSYTNGATTTIVAGDVEKNIAPLLDIYSILPNRTIGLVNNALNQAYLPTQSSSTFVYLMNWSTQNDGFYHMSTNYRGVTAAFGVVLQYAMAQYSSSGTTQCEYYGQAGSGLVVLALGWQFFLITSGGYCIMWIIGHYVMWFRRYRYHPNLSRVQSAIQNPLILGYDLRQVWTDLHAPDFATLPEEEFETWCESQSIIFAKAQFLPAFRPKEKHVRKARTDSVDS